MASEFGHVPNGAISAGCKDDGEALYIGRASIRGNITVGKVQPSHGCLYVPFDGDEHCIQRYEILVERPIGTFNELTIIPNNKNNRL